MAKRKQLTFDIDTNVAKQILGEHNYTHVYSDIRSFMEKEKWKHIEGSVYVSNVPIDNTDMFWMIQSMKEKYPYLTKCVREMHQADISKVHSLNHYFEYDGTPGRSPPQKESVRNKLKQNQELIEQQKKHGEIEKNQKPRGQER